MSAGSNRPGKPREANPYGVEGIDVASFRPAPPPGPAPAPMITPGAGVYCHECGYDLASIASDAPCPECGAGRRRANVALPTLSEMPVGYISLTALGFVCTSLGALYPFVVVVADMFAGPSLGAGTGGIPVFTYVIAAALWVGGLWLVSRPPPYVARREKRPEEGWKSALSLRWITVGMESGWVVAMLLWTVGASSTLGANTVLLWTEGVFAIIGLAGIIPTALLLARVADFTADTDLGRRIRNAVWGICMSVGAMTLTRAVPTVYGGAVLRLFDFLFFLWLTVSVIVFLFSNVALLRLCTLAIGHKRRAEAITARLIEKARTEAMEERAKRAVEIDRPAPDVYHYIGTKPTPDRPYEDGKPRR